jgi:hypothetical protein
VPGAAPAGRWQPTAAFVKGTAVPFPAHFTDGTSNTILIVEAGNAVPWTKPEDLHYAADEPLPELGGLFRDVFHAAFADGYVHTLTKKYDETTLRAAITANGGEVLDIETIEARPRRGLEPPTHEDLSDVGWQRKNEALRRQLERERERLRLLREERDVQRDQSARAQVRPADPREEALRRENARLQADLDKVRAECETLEKEISSLQRPTQRKGP